MARQSIVTVDLGHVLSDLVAHAPRCFIRYAKLALQFLRRYTMPGRGEHIHRIEPKLERGAGSLERCSGHRMNVMSTPRTLISRHLFDARKPPMLAALRTVQRFAKAKLHQVVKACRIIRETLEEVLNSKGFGHGGLQL